MVLTRFHLLKNALRYGANKVALVTFIYLSMIVFSFLEISGSTVVPVYINTSSILNCKPF